MAPYPTDDETTDFLVRTVDAVITSQGKTFSGMTVQSETTSEGYPIWHFCISRRYEVLGLAYEDPHNFFSFSEEEARRLVSSAGLPLFGRIPPEKYHLLDPQEAMLERDMFQAGVFEDDLCICQRPWDIYDLLELLVDKFNHVDTRTPRALSQANIKHVATVTKRLRTLIQSLEEPSTQLFSGGKPMDDFMHSCKEQLAKFDRWARILDHTDRGPGGDQSLEGFIRGPLADVYGRLSSAMQAATRPGHLLVSAPASSRWWATRSRQPPLRALSRSSRDRRRSGGTCGSCVGLPNGVWRRP